MKRTCLLPFVAFLLATTPVSGLAQTPHDLFQQALVKERAEGNLEEAIQLYQRVVAEAGNNRELAAKALVQMGGCYEKLGNEKAREAYERVLREYADQSDSVANARVRLAALEQLTETDVAEYLTIRRLWTVLDVAHGNLHRPSPDGRYLSYLEPYTGNLAIYEFATKTTRPLTKGAVRPGVMVLPVFSAWSPDSRRLAYSLWNMTENSCELRIIGIDGSEQGTLYKCEDGMLVLMDWSTDGKYILFAVLGNEGNEGQIALISVADGSVRPLTNWTESMPYGGGGLLSPDGRYIVGDLRGRNDPPGRDIFIASIEGWVVNPLVEHTADDRVLGWAPDGKRILFASDRTGTWDAWIMEVVDGRAQGEPELIKKDIGKIWPKGMTRDGSFYYGAEYYMKDVYLAELNLDTGELLHPPQSVNQRFTGSTSGPNWSPDGKYLLYRINLDTTPEQFRPESPFRIRSLETGEDYELSIDLKSFGSVRWFSDSRSILVQASDEKDCKGYYRVDAQTGSASLILEHDWNDIPVWSPDGDKFFFIQWEEDLTSNIWVYDLTTKQKLEFYNQTDMIVHLAASPDGQYLAFDTWDGDIYVLKIMPSTGGEPRVLLELTEGEEFLAIAWTPDASGLLYGKGVQNEQESEVWRIPVAGGEPHKLGLEVEGLGRLTIHPDGRRIAFVSKRGGFDVWVMKNFLPPLEEKHERR